MSDKSIFNNIFQVIFYYIFLLIIVLIIIFVNSCSCGKAPLPAKKVEKVTFRDTCIDEIMYQERIPHSMKEGAINFTLKLDENDNPIDCVVPLEERF